jgi:hypothetical protein
MRLLISILLILSACSCREHESKVSNSVNSDTLKKNHEINEKILDSNIFFTMADTAKDIQYIDSFFALVYSEDPDISIKNVRFFFPSNEEEIAYIDSEVKDVKKRNALEDSIYTSHFYKSRFFPVLAQAIRSRISKHSLIKINFNGFDTISEPEGNSYDTSYVKYQIVNKGIRTLTFFIPYIRDGEYAIANIYDSDNNSLIDKVCDKK